MILDEVMPSFEQREIHAIRIAASPERVLDALRRLTPAEMPAVSALLALRGLPARLAGKSVPRLAGERPLLSLMEDKGYLPLGEDPGREAVYGVIGPFWKLTANTPVRVRGPEAFEAFAEPGNAKVAISFRAEPEGRGTRLSTETRIVATDEDARRRFQNYWRLARPGSGLVRILWLRAVKRRAERA